MRIAVYCPHYEDAGGVQEVVRRLSAGMVVRGHAVHLVARLPGGGGPALAARDASTGAAVSRVRFVRAPYRGAGARAYRHFAHRYPSSAIHLVHAVKTARPELIATHCSKFHAPYVAALRAALRVPFVVHLHNGPRTADGPESLVLSRLLLRCASRVIAVSAAVGDYARGVLPARAGRVVTIPNGADQDEFAAVAPAVRARPYVLGAGALAERKGFDVLIDAFANTRIDLDLVLAGDGPERARLRRARQDADLRSRRVPRTRRPGDGREPPPRRPRRRDAVALRGHPRRPGSDARRRALVASEIPGLPAELRHGETGLLVPRTTFPRWARTRAPRDRAGRGRAPAAPPARPRAVSELGRGDRAGAARVRPSADLGSEALPPRAERAAERERAGRRTRRASPDGARVEPSRP
jgi:hypothetical protein